MTLLHQFCILMPARVLSVELNTDYTNQGNSSLCGEKGCFWSDRIQDDFV